MLPPTARKFRARASAVNIKIIVAGATGFIGSEVLRQCLQHSSIHTAVALVRRKLEGIDDPKLTQVIMKDEDFLDYPPHVIEASEAPMDASALSSIATLDEVKACRVNHDYAIAAGKAFASAAVASGSKMQFVLVDGWPVEQNQIGDYGLINNFKELRYKTRDSLVGIAKANLFHMAASIARPGSVEAKTTSEAGVFKRREFSIDSTVDELALVLVDLAVNPSTQMTLDKLWLLVQGWSLFDGGTRVEVVH